MQVGDTPSLISEDSIDTFVEGAVVLLICGHHHERQLVQVQRSFNLRTVYAQYRPLAEVEAVLDRENTATMMVELGILHAAEGIRAGRLLDQPAGALFLRYLFDQGYLQPLDAIELHIHTTAYHKGIVGYDTVA
jgi:hypothetical protein